MPVFQVGEFKPQLDPTVFIAPGAVVVGRVTIGAETSVWFNTVIRGDADIVQIGERTNIQDGSILHQDPGFPLIIGSGVTIGHNAIIHGCIIEDEALIGMGAIILNGARIGRGAVVAAGSLIRQGQEVPPYTLVAGTPAVIKRQVKPEELEEFRRLNERYRSRGYFYRHELREV